MNGRVDNTAYGTRCHSSPLSAKHGALPHPHLVICGNLTPSLSFAIRVRQKSTTNSQRASSSSWPAPRIHHSRHSPIRFLASSLTSPTEPLTLYYGLLFFFEFSGDVVRQRAPRRRKKEGCERVGILYVQVELGTANSCCNTLKGLDLGI